MSYAFETKNLCIGFDKRYPILNETKVILPVYLVQMVAAKAHLSEQSQESFQNVVENFY